MSQKLTGRLTVLSQTIKVKNVTTTTELNVALTDGLYFILNDLVTSIDLILHIKTAILAAHIDFATFEITVDQDTGIITLADTGAVGFLITWAAATDIRDWLRFSGATTSVPSGGSTSGARTHEFGFYPSRCAPEDIANRDVEAANLQADNGDVQTLTFADHSEHLLMFTILGGPYSDVWREFHAFDDFMAMAVQSIPYRWYHDTSVLAEYAFVVAATGFLQLVLKASVDWEPMTRGGRYYGDFEAELPSYRVTP